MATVTRTFLVDDLDGSDDDVSPVSFSLDKEELRDRFERSQSGPAAGQTSQVRRRCDTGSGRNAGERRLKAVKSSPVGREQTQAIREWARTNGYQVSERGRISAVIQKAFDEAH